MSPLPNAPLAAASPHDALQRLLRADDVAELAVALGQAARAWVPGTRVIPGDTPDALPGLQSPAAATKAPALLEWLRELAEQRREQMLRRDRLQATVAHLEKADRLQRALYAIAEQASAQRELSAVLRTLHEIVGSLTYAENFFIALHDARSDSVRFAYYADIADREPPDPLRPYPLDDMRHSATWHLIRGGRALMGPLDAIAAAVQGPFLPNGPTCVDFLGVPLLRGQETVGCIAVQSYREDARYREEDRALLSYVAQHIQTALERREAQAELERRVTERTEALREANRVLQQQVLERQRGERLQAALFRIAELAGTTESLEAFYAAMHRVVGGLLYARNFYIALLSDDGEELTFPYSVDERDPSRRPRRLGRGMTEYVLQHGTAQLAHRSDIERMHACGEIVASGATAECWLGVPLIIGERTVGVLTVQSYTPEHRYTARDQDLLTFVSYQIANALDRKRAAESLKQANTDLERRVGERTRALAMANRDLREQVAERERAERRLKYEALHDTLTGLPNRALLMQRLEHALDRHRIDPERLFAVLFLDLDRFKVINDSVGHLVGDDLLFQAGGRIRACLKSQDVVARLGGDEFAVLVEGIADVGEAERVADRIITAMRAPFRLGAKEMFTSTSIGIALAAPHYRRPEELLRDADSAMYRAKAEGRQRYAIFDERLRREAVSLLELEVDLRRALARGEFEPFYQPIVSLEDGRVAGFEALLRWRHPVRGVLAPGEFLGVAEDNGSSEAIDWMMFEQVAAQIPLLTAEGGFVSINLSGRHFRSDELAPRLLDLFDRHRVQPACVRVEVTERTLLESPATVKCTLGLLREQGIGIALDDFGTGYSSLSYLHQYPLQSLKIDRSFIIGLPAQGQEGGTLVVVRAILALAHSLGMQVIAEGIETEAQRRTLAALGCVFGQGFLFAEPKSADTWGVAAAAVPAIG